MPDWVQHVRETVEKATEGPWTHGKDETPAAFRVIGSDGVPVADCLVSTRPVRDCPPNQDLIALLGTSAPALAALVEAADRVGAMWTDENLADLRSALSTLKASVEAQMQEGGEG